jgi:anthranilate phosphoribosyltransferase
MQSATEALSRIIAGRDLTERETEELFGLLMDGELSNPMKAALLAALATKGESAAEVAGAARAMRQRVLAVECRRKNVVDTCGTGGDQRGTFNISTAAALVAAAADVPVAKHGNRSVSSRSGSADVLAALGIEVEMTPQRAAEVLDRIGISFFFAPAFHPAMRQVMPVRRELGVRTLFNVLGPLTNPAGARRQVLGVYSSRLVDLVAEVLVKLGCEHALVVYGEDGLDELTTTATNHVAEVRNGRIERYAVEPELLGLQRAALADLAGGDPETNAELMNRVLAGEGGPLGDIVGLNAGAAIYVGGRAATLKEGAAAAQEVLAAGAALAKLSQLRSLCGGSED